MRIAVIAHLKYAIREPFAGGLEMHTHLLYSALRNRGHAVTVFASTRSEPKAGLEAICDETSLYETGSEESNDIPFFKEHHAYLSLMNSLKNSDFDVIHNNSLHYMPVVMADAMPMPILTTLHTPPFCWLESGIRLCKSPNAAFVAVSDSVRKAWSKVTQIESVIHNGIDLRRFPFRAEPDPEPYLIWYGRIVPEKGLHYALDASRALGMNLRFAGPIVDTEYFDREIQPRLTDRVLYLGHLPHAELAAAIGGARAFLCTPVWEEPYGLVVAEALACGVPVAAFARGGIPEILDSSCGVLSAPNDATALANAAAAAQGLTRDDCRRRAETVCDAAAMIDKYERLYEKMIERSRPIRHFPPAEQNVTPGYIATVALDNACDPLALA
jgi:glycosyltransferase involved in cell wall biosynthesis